MLALVAVLALTVSSSAYDTLARTDSTVDSDSAVVARDGVRITGIPLPLPAAMTAARDTLPRRRRAIVYSDAYGTRLTIHRYASYALLPVFVTQYVLGNRLLQQKQDVFAGTRLEPVDADLRRTHRVVATSLASLFVINTTTGLWNLYEARDDPAARGLRTAHALTMLAADAGFVAVAVLGSRATETAPTDARRHRHAALGSMVLSTGGAAMMWLFNRR
jgi:hypothetical protein